MKKLICRCAITLTLLPGVAYAGTDAPACPSGSTPRFEIVNNCDTDVWVVETPPGNPTQPTVPAQWDWFKAYTTQENPNVPGVRA